MERAIVIKEFKYNGEILERGDVFEPTGGKHDHKILDPDKRFVKFEKSPEYECDYCDRAFDTPQGKAAHMRFCDKKE